MHSKTITDGFGTFLVSTWEFWQLNLNSRLEMRLMFLLDLTTQLLPGQDAWEDLVDPTFDRAIGFT